MFIFKLRDGKRVSECLKRCLKIAGQCVDTNAQLELNVDILNYFVYFYEAKNENVTFIIQK
jgi:vacuolar protein sorting-associated protein 35